MPSGSSVELSHKGYQFLANLFERYDKDRDEALSPKEVEAIFSTCPTPAFNACVRDMVPTNSKVSFFVVECYLAIGQVEGDEFLIILFTGLDHARRLVLFLGVHYFV